MKRPPAPNVLRPVDPIREYRYSPGARAGAAFFILCFVAWVGFILWAYFAGFDASMRRISPGGLLALISVPFGMLLFTLYWANGVFGAILTDASGLEIRKVVGSIRREFHEFERLEPLRSSREGFVLWSPDGASFNVATDGLTDAKELREYVKTRIVPGPKRALEETEFRTVLSPVLFVVVAAVAVLFFVAPWLMYGARSDAWPLHVLYDVVAFLMVALAVQGATTRVILHPDRIEKRSALGSQSVRYADVRKVELDLMSSRGGSIEVVRLIHTGRDFSLSPQISHFTQIRDTLIQRCPQAAIRDSRPAEHR